ncbi:hypothetical protein ACIRQP_40360 [Streptomyces sp. NPDC102274]|uniref:hypothetical protein n=1 Tax=Streptomyces sp. NPDC102274 TaxID=3366151 RepID=UPI0038059718
MESTNRAAAWLGIATSIIGVLAFFGVTNFEQIQKALDPNAARAEACGIARDAQREARRRLLIGQPSDHGRYMEEQLRRAADATDDAKLRDDLRTTADGIDLLADAWEGVAGRKVTNSAIDQMQQAELRWRDYCISHGTTPW